MHDNKFSTPTSSRIGRAPAVALCGWLALAGLASEARADSLGFMVNSAGDHDYGRQLVLPAGFGDGEFTLEVWVKPDDSFPIGSTFSGPGQLINWSDADEQPYSQNGWWFDGNFLLDGHNNPGGFERGTFSLQFYGGGRIRWLFGDGRFVGPGGHWSVGAYPASNAPSLLDGAWHQITLVRRWTGNSDALLELWVDGGLTATELSNLRTNMRQWWDGWPSYTAAQAGWFWGAEKKAAVDLTPQYEDYKGLVDELRFWSRAKSALEIQSGYALGVNGSEPGLVGVYVFEDIANNQTCNALAPSQCMSLVRMKPGYRDPENAPADSLSNQNALPVAIGANLAVQEDTGAGATLLATDANNDPLTFRIVSSATQGSAVITNAASGAYTYTPNPNYNGSDNFRFVANDGSGDSSPATVSISVAPVNDPPAVSNGALTSEEDSAGNGTLGASDPDGDALTFSIVSAPGSGNVVIDNAMTGAYTYTPNANFAGPDSFTFRVNDGTVNSANATVTITVTAVNDPPSAQAGSLSTAEDTAASGTLLANDVDGDAVSYALAVGAAQGSVTITNTVTGAYTYTPNANYNGADSFSFQASDAQSSANGIVSITVTPVNDAPVASGGSLNATEDNPAGGNLTVADADNDPLTYVLTDSGSQGNAVIVNAATGAYTYTPNPDFNGTDTLSFLANDGNVDSNTASITVSVAASNDLPVALAGNLAAVEDQAASAILLANDVDGDTLTYSLVSPATAGTVVLTDSASGAYTYTPGTDYNGADSFSFRARDASGFSNPATVSVSVAARNDAPVASDGALAASAGQQSSAALSASDADGDALTFALVNGAAQGTVVITDPASGSYTYTANAGAAGNDSFTFTASDGVDVSGVATVSISVTAANQIPVAQNGALGTAEDTAANGNLSASDGDGDSLSYTLVDAPARGVALITDPNTGAFSYTPQSDYFGADQFTFRVNDGTDDSNVATVSLTISPQNDPPQALAGSFATAENTANNGFVTATDVDGDSLSYAIVSGAGAGTATITNAASGAFTYTPNAGFSGSDSFTFQASDAQAGSNVATVSIDVIESNGPPVALAGSLSVTEDIAASGTLIALDADNDPLTYTIVGNPTRGSVLITDAATGAYTYTPQAEISGADSFSFRANDGVENSNVATVTLTIAAANDAPTASNATLTTEEDRAGTGTLAGSDIDGDPLTFSLVSNAAAGTVVIDNPASGAYTYTPGASFTGSDSFTFRVNDGSLNSSPALVSITVTPANDAPTAASGALVVDEDTAGTGTLVGNDLDGDPLTYTLVTGAGQGSVQITDPATGSYSYTPNPNYNGSDSFTFRVSDGFEPSNTAQVAITVTPRNDPPAALNGTLGVDEDTPALGTLLGTDPDGDALTFEILNSPTRGSAVLLNPATGSFSYTPDAGVSGIDTISFRVGDGNLFSGNASVTVTIAAVNDMPVAANGMLSVAEDTAGNGLLAGSDPDGDALTYALVTGAGNGTAVITNPATGAYTYQPNADFFGADAFSYRVSDGRENSNVATVAISVSPRNDAPTALAATLAVTEDGSVTATLTASDADGDPLSYSLLSGAGQGSVALLDPATGAYRYTPNADYNGGDSFEFRASDGLLSSVAATITISVSPANDPPVAADGAIVLDEDSVASARLAGSDIDDDVLSFALAANPANGNVSIVNAATGDYTYTPDFNYNGPDSFTFRVSDGLLQSAARRVDITVNPVNDPPVSQDQVLSTAENTALFGVLGASDVENDAFQFALIRGAQRGTVTIDDPDSGDFSYLPNAFYRGPDSFTFVATDSTGTSNVATVAIAVVDASGAPVAIDGQLTVLEDTSGRGRLFGSDGENDPLEYTLVDAASNGTVVITDRDTGDYIYTPMFNYSGADSFSFRVSDGAASSDPARVTIAVIAVNDSPRVPDSSLQAEQDTEITGHLAAMDSDGDAVTFHIVKAPSNGSVEIVDASSGQFVFRPNPGFSGEDTFSYVARDANLTSNYAIVDVSVVPANTKVEDTSEPSASASGRLVLAILMAAAFMARRRRKFAAR